MNDISSIKAVLTDEIRPPSLSMTPILEGFLPLWILACLSLSVIASMIIPSWTYDSEVPTVGATSRFEASVISNYRFYKKAENVLEEGYRKVIPPPPL